MMKLLRFLCICIIATLVACSPDDTSNKAQTIVDQLITKHGGDNYNDLAIGFTFREKSYSIKLKGSDYTYTRSYTDSLGFIKDVLQNGAFRRTIDGKTAVLTEKQIQSYTNSINSVAYFTLLPKALNDDAVNKSYGGAVTMGGQEYHTIIVTFDQEGGGVDHDDEYRYWIHKANHTLDYFAYNYQVNEGGTRFRSVVDWKIIDSVRYQNYINWMPEKKFEPLDNLPGLFDSGALKEVSRIINEDIESLR